MEDLYEGLGSEYIRCLHCDHLSAHETKFLDLGLTVKDPFSGKTHASLLEALCTLLKPEKLEGENKFFCSKCEAKQEALKGFQLIKLPRILCINLNRFTLDYNTLQRVKLNDRLAFPPVLEMNPLLQCSAARSSLAPEQLAALEEKNPFLKLKFKYKPGLVKVEEQAGLDGEKIPTESEERFKAALENELEYEGPIATLEQKPKRKFMKRGEGTSALGKAAAVGKGKKPVKKKPTTAGSSIRSKFRQNLNPEFFANAHAAPVDEVKGWAMDIAPEKSYHRNVPEVVPDTAETPKDEKTAKPGEEKKEIEKEEEAKQIVDTKKAEAERKEKEREIEKILSEQRRHCEPFSYEIYAILVH